MFRSGLVGLAASFAVAVASAAQAQSVSRLSNPTEIMPDYNLATLQAVVTELGATSEVIPDGGQSSLGVKMPSGAVFIMTPTACNPNQNRCTGVSIRAVFTGYDDSPASVNRFNQMGTPPKVVQDGQNSVMYEYLINEFGMPKGNFDVYIAVFEFSLGRYVQFLEGGNGLRQSSSLANNVSLAEEANHVGTIPLGFARHPNAFTSLGNIPDAYKTKNDR